MFVIGITGPIGVGKSYVSEKISRFGIPIIDTDKVYHGLISYYSETVRELEAEFGKEILTSERAVDREKLGRIVFSDPERLSALNAVTHKHIRLETLRLLEEKKSEGCRAVILEVPLMYESGFDAMCDTTVCVVADEYTRLQRIMKRDGIGIKDAEKKLKNQKDIDFYIANSKKIVYNSMHDDVDAQVSALIKEIP